MITWFSRFIATLFILTIVGLVTVTVFLRPSQKANRQEMRQIALQKIADSVSAYLATHQQLPEGLSDGWHQLGTAKKECELSNQYCHVENPSCSNLSFLLGDPETRTMPADPSTGTVAKTGYAIKFEEPDKLMVSSCGNEGTEPITLTRTVTRKTTPDILDSDTNSATPEAKKE